jgi:predicted secreted Zn-dependent protease
MLHLVVMLPRHETPDDLPADLRGRWERFVARVAAHEQRHVDIYLKGAKAMKARLEATRTAVSCADLENKSSASVDAGRADLVAPHNALAGRRGALAEEYNRLVADANGLIDALNWARW